MSKETAHQLGTPISSLMAWVELLRLQKNDPAIVGELENDIQRLEKITERFSKIGSKPELLHTDMETVIRSTLEYLKRRSSGKIKYEFHTDGTNKWEVPLNEALFSWVIENLCKNAMDAMNGEGTITISLKEKENNVIVDLSDTGKGLHKSQYKTIFQPGYSTKKRGWGLGLSLAKRIVENYHKGKIFIKESEINKGTTFRILLKKNA
jgi:signal transduction histidine kinase